MMVLYSGTTCPYSHRCRFVLFEKGMDFEIRDVDLFAKPEDIALMNPYNEVPILVERDLILYESHIINEYIDERFPHPQLMPGDPVARARVRLFLFNFEKELFAHVNLLESRGDIAPDSPEAEAFVQGVVKDTVMHEVGHTLGLKHNFKSSTAYTRAQLQDKAFTEKNGISGSVMDYNAYNIALAGERQGSFNNTTIGPYDYWAIEYAYKPSAAEH